MWDFEPVRPAVGSSTQKLHMAAISRHIFDPTNAYIVDVFQLDLRPLKTSSDIVRASTPPIRQWLTSVRPVGANIIQFEVLPGKITWSGICKENIKIQ